jgi:competence protein ComEC
MRRPRAAIGTLPERSWSPGQAAWLSTLYQWFADRLAREVEYRSGFLWLPFAFGLGILLYFAAREEPVLWAGPALGSFALTLAIITRDRMRLAMIVLLFVSSGFSAATIQTARVGTPILARDFFGEIKGFVESIDTIRNRRRLTIRTVSMENIAAEAMPYRLRVGVPGNAALEPGGFVTVRARLMPPSDPAMPGGYDFRHEAFFQSIGGVGYAIGTLSESAPPSPPPLDLRLTAAIDSWRNHLTARIARAIGGDSGALAAALITGKRGLISDDANEDLRGAGLYHIVSISGLHMVLAAGVMFWSLRAFLALFPSVALRRPIKKYAAAGAMLGATAYCTFSGAEVATIRSLIMTLVMLGAILVDRPALAMRNLAISALIVLAREPHSLLGPSFQMSFSAVGCLIAANRIWHDWRNGPRTREFGPLGRFGVKLALAFLGIAATTLVATLATAPFSAFHFHRLNPYGIIGNSLGIPLVSLIVMPSAVAGTLLLPFGLDYYVWKIMGEGVAGVLAVADWVASIENASLAAPQIGRDAFAALVVALLVFTGLRTALRSLALIPLAIGLALARTPALPDIVVDQNGSMALVRAPDGRYRVLAPARVNRFTLGQWLPALGDNRQTDAASLKEGTRCDTLGCSAALADGRIIMLVVRADAQRVDCQRAAVVITRLPQIAACDERRTLTREHFARYGATRVTTRDAGDWRTATTLDPAINRPWRRSTPVDTKPPIAVTPPSSPRANTIAETPDDDPAIASPPVQ